MPRLSLPSEISLTPAAIGGAVLLACVALVALDPANVVGHARERAFDLVYAAFPRRDIQARVVVVDVDDSSLARLGGWPLPRAQFSNLIDRLVAARAKAVGFDIFFDGPDRASPLALARRLSSLSGGEAVRPLIPMMPDTDSGFAEALRKSPSVLGALAAPDDRTPTPDFNMISGGDAIDQGYLVQVDGFSGPYTPLADAALGMGALSLFGEEGGLVRRVPLLFAANGSIAPSLSLETARIADADNLISIDSGNARIVFGHHFTPLVLGGAMRIHWSEQSHWSDRTISAGDLLDVKISDDRFRDAIVLVGSSAPEAGALRPTSTSPLTPTVQIEADAVEQLLDETAPREPTFSSTINVVTTSLLGAGGIFLMLVRGPLVGIAALAALIGAWLTAIVALFLSARLLIDPVAPAMAALIAGNSAASASYARTRHLKAFISQRFEQYLAPDVVRAILADPTSLKREGEMRIVTALFTDIEDFTRLTTSMEPKSLISLLDAYFDGVCRIIIEHGGMIDLIVGDAVHAFFNMPRDLDAHADRAVACADAIIEYTEAFRATPAAAAVAFGRTRVGVETGEAIVGNVGGSRRLNYTAHGSVSNAAARLEAANKSFGTSVCIGPGTAAAVRHTRLVAIGQIQLRGFDQTIEVFAHQEMPVNLPMPGPEQYAPESNV